MASEQIDLLPVGDGHRGAHIADAAERVMSAVAEIVGDGDYARLREMVLADGRDGLCKRLLAAHRPLEASLLFGRTGMVVYAALAVRVER